MWFNQQWGLEVMNFLAVEGTRNRKQIIAATIATVGKGSEQENESKMQISKRRSKGGEGSVVFDGLS